MRNITTLIKNLMSEYNIPYTFDEWDDDLELPQFVGEILEVPTVDEDGKNEYSFILTGYGKSYNYLFEISEFLRTEFKTSSIIDGVAIKYENTTTISSDNDDLKQIQINLTIKEWRV